MLREDLNDVVKSLLPIYMFMAGPVLFIALFGLFFMDSPDDGCEKRLDELEKDARYIEMELDFIRNMYGI